MSEAALTFGSTEETAGSRRPALVIDADYAVLRADAFCRPALAQPAEAPRPAPGPGQGLEALREPPRPAFLSQPGGAAFWTLGILAAALVFWASGGHALFLP